MDNLNFRLPPVQISDFSTRKVEYMDTPINHAYSDTQFEIIKKYVLDFQESLDSEHDVGMMLTNFGNSILMEVTEIGYEKSVLMVFKGLVNGRQSTLVQHINQLNFLLTSVPKSPDIPKREIGFTANWAAG